MGASDTLTALYVMMLFMIGAIVMRAAGCVINDMWDRRIDRKIARTATRPLASGKISMARAFCLLAVLGLIGLSVLLQLPMMAWVMGLASLPLIVIYPLCKRVTYWPQIMLGLTFSWGALLGYVATAQSWPSAPILLLYVGSVLWVVGYDTIYAIQDMADDAKVGVKSSALALAGRIGRVVRLIFMASIILIGAGLYGFYGAVSYWLGGLAAMAVHLLWQSAQIDEASPKTALKLFKSNRDAGLLLTAGLLAQSLLA